MTKIEQLAALLKSMTYDEVMEFAESVSWWTEANEDMEMESGARFLSQDDVARLLSDWAEGTQRADAA